ncbi:DUF4238 domain-containing protein [Arthrobacter sp. KNU40]|uniref:DUF4238 domain-containing protein n=1 Tax=Arthrobacter sp. KNU40 TaxID=3447965 RepID=UPI003F5E62B0
MTTIPKGLHESAELPKRYAQSMEEKLSSQPSSPDVPVAELPEDSFLRELVERSRTNDAARKHHVVPNSYLRRWSGPTHRVQVSDLNTGKSYVTSPGNAARVTDFYLLESPDLDPDEIPPAFVENLLALIEGRAVPALDTLLAHSADGMSGQDKADISVFLGFQLARGQQTREMIQQLAADISPHLHSVTNMTEDGIKALLASKKIPFTEQILTEVTDFQKGLQDGSIVMLPQQAALVGMPISMAMELAEHLYIRHWVLFRTRPILFTSDEPVVAIGGPGRPRNRRAGIGTAPVVVFPIAPDALLVMFSNEPRPEYLEDLTLIELAEVNRETAASASRWVIDREGRKAALAFDIPPWPDSVTSVEEQTIENGNKLMHGTWLNRWAGTDSPPPWPVLRWFQ